MILYILISVKDLLRIIINSINQIFLVIKNFYAQNKRIEFFKKNFSIPKINNFYNLVN